LPGAPELSDFGFALFRSVVAAAFDGPAKHARSPVASIKAESPPVLTVIGNLPILPAPAAKGALGACPQRGKKRESSGYTRQKQGKHVGGDLAISEVSAAKPFWNQSAGCQPGRSML
jgi:hypothetical protein